ncbi:DUF6157 family protein [Microbacterium sp. RU33B]|uniref:DUF6157 family protein n=1 Tax=Microbacterium sp. RU33B TaxID=1907390 RepID=UPI00096608E3|nr:DUF6157 family protein [Microbacterium sp. RU33B]SIT70706.1 hypothetical protein SAMN05880545_0740 [Microbacterium sp. RU33B]
MHTTNYHATFIEVADDCPIDHAVEPPAKDEPTIAQLHYELIAERPYALTSDDVVFETHARRAGIADGDQEAARAAFFSKGQPCLRSSPLGKRYGWGIHHDAEGRVALVPRESAEYARLASDDGTAHTRAMRSRRA